MSALSLNQKIRQKWKDWWSRSRFLINLNNARKQTLLPWVMQYGFKESRKESKYHKLHKDLTKTV